MVTRILPRSICGALVPLAIALSSDAAQATTCGRDPDATTVPPPIGVRAPRNVQPRITLHANWRVQSFCPPWGNDRRFLAGRFDLSLRAAGAVGPVTPIALRESTSGEVATVVIIPAGPLAPNERFEVVYVEQDAKEAPRILATFTTGDRIDDKPPIWAGVTSHSKVGAWPHATPPRPQQRAKPGVIVLDALDCGGPGLAFKGLLAATDDDTRAEDLRYAVWMGDPDAPIDYTAPPLAYESGTLEPQRSSGMALVVLFGGRLSPNGFSFPAGKRTVKVGLRAIDLAGNASAPSEQLVNPQ